MSGIVSNSFALVISSAVVVAAPAGEPSYDELRHQVQQLQDRLESLEKSSGARRAADADQVIRSVLADANQRSRLFAADGALTAGYDKGFFIKSEDGKFLLKPGLQWQFRNTSTYRSQTAQGDDDFQNGFESRRLRFRFDGNAFGPDLTYSFVFDASRSTGGVSLLDGFVQYKFAKDWAIKGGQFKEFFSQEYNVSGFSQLAADRSLASYALGGAITDRVQGAALVYGSKSNPLRAEAAIHDGANSKNTDYRDPDTNPTEWGAGARVEYKLLGDWSNYRDFTANGTNDDLLVAGAGLDATERENSITYLTTIDAQYENPSGLSLYGALHANFTELRNIAGDDSRLDWGFIAQTGYAFAGNWEVFARASFIELDDDFVSGEDNFSEYTLGANYYLGDRGAYLHRAKVTVDVSYLPDGSPSDFTGAGILASDDEEVVLRGQFVLQI